MALFRRHAAPENVTDERLDPSPPVRCQERRAQIPVEQPDDVLGDRGPCEVRPKRLVGRSGHRRRTIAMPRRSPAGSRGAWGFSHRT